MKTQPTVKRETLAHTFEDMLDETLERYFNKEATRYEVQQDLELWLELRNS